MTGGGREGKTGINLEWQAPLKTSKALQKFIFFKGLKIEVMEITQTAASLWVLPRNVIKAVSPD